MDLPAVSQSPLASITADVALEIASAYTDQIVFPNRILIDSPQAGDRRFPGRSEPILVLSVENQGVCAWGVPLNHANPPVLVGGDIVDRTGYIRGTTQYSTVARQFGIDVGGPHPGDQVSGAAVVWKPASVPVHRWRTLWRQRL